MRRRTIGAGRSSWSPSCSWSPLWRPRGAATKRHDGTANRLLRPAEVAELYVRRFRPEFLAAYEAWLDTRPLSDPDAPPTPFAMDEYQVASKDEAERLDRAAETSAAEVRLNIQRSSNYVLTVVLYAVVLFFAGMSTRLQDRRLRWVTTIAGCITLLGALAWLATFPVSVAV